MTAPVDRREPWQERARCKGFGALFFAEGEGAQLRHRQAAAICAGCPVTRQCLKLAMVAEGGASEGSRYGVFGGLNSAQRRALYERRVDRQNEARRLAAAQRAIPV